MLAVAGRADLLGKFDDLLIRGEAGNGEQVGRGVNVSRGCGVPDCDVESMAVGWQSIAELEETVCTDVVGGSGERERLSLEGDAQEATIPIWSRMALCRFVVRARDLMQSRPWVGLPRSG